MKDQAWPADKVERRAVADLAPYARNARTHSEEQVRQIADSIGEWGWTVPILVDETGMIIAGHGRVMAADLLGIEEVPCMVAAGWSEEQKRAYVIADNKLAENAGWDVSVLTDELVALGDVNFDLGLTGFGEVELDTLFAKRTAGNTDPDDVPEPQAEAITKPGDVWLLGAYFECEDCGKKYDYEVGREMEACPCDQA